MNTQFDAIVIGSGITGGWAAKELTQQGLKVLMIERGRHIEHGRDYTTETKAPWEMPFRGFGDSNLIARDYQVQSKGREFDEWTQSHFVNDRENPYHTDPDCALPVDPRLPARRQVADLGTAVVSLERH